MRVVAFRKRLSYIMKEWGVFIMKIVNFGALNIDQVLGVKEIVRPGQTIDSYSCNTFPGGKGLNQSLAIARAGTKVYHAGLIGQDGEFLRSLLEESGVDCQFMETIDVNTGAAYIQVDEKGQNSIVLNGGANRENTREYCDEVLSNFEKDDIVLIQNEISNVDYIIDKAYRKGLFVIFNPSPMNETVLKCNLSHVSMFIMNEDEGARISEEMEPEKIIQEMSRRYPLAQVILTIGSKGSIYVEEGVIKHQESCKVKSIDTTAAGDTYTGYFIAEMVKGKNIGDCVRVATKASALAVTKQGASTSIPYYLDTRKFNA